MIQSKYDVCRMSIPGFRKRISGPKQVTFSKYLRFSSDFVVYRRVTYISGVVTFAEYVKKSQCFGRYIPRNRVVFWLLVLLLDRSVPDQKVSHNIYWRPYHFRHIGSSMSWTRLVRHLTSSRR